MTKHLLLALALAATTARADWQLECHTGEHLVTVDRAGKRVGEARKAPPAGPLATTPAGARRLAVRTTGGDAEIWISDADGSNARQLTDNKAIDNFPCWADGAIVFASTRSGTWQLYRMAIDGSGVEQLTDHPLGAWRPVVSPDGAHVAYQTRTARRGKLPPTTLRAMDLASKRSRPLLEKTQMLGCAWSPDGKRIAVALVGAVAILEAATGKRVGGVAFKDVDGRLHAHAASAMLWRPDGKAIACNIGFLGGRMAGTVLFGDTQVFLLPLDGGKATHFELSAKRERFGTTYRAAARPVRWRAPKTSKK